MIPLSVCSQAISLLEAFKGGAFVSVSKRDAWMIHGLEDLSAGSLVYEGAYTELGHIFFVGEDAFAYKINIDKEELSRA